MERWERVVAFPLRRVWISLATRLGIRRPGLRRLRKEVRSCEHEDVRVMWEMLWKTDPGIGRHSPVGKPIQRRRRRFWSSLFHCAPRNLCCSF